MLILRNFEYLCKLNTTGSFPAEESLLVELMEEHCSRPDEMCNRVQNIFAVWNIGWKGSPAWVKQANNLNLRFFFVFCFFVALDVVELCMMVTVMQFIYLFFTVSCTALTWKASEISTLCILPATQQKPNKRKKCDGLFPMFPQNAEQQMQMIATSKQLQSHGNNKLYLPGGAECCFFFVFFWIWHLFLFSILFITISINVQNFLINQ